MALCLLICLSTVSIITSVYISDLTISSCFQKLRDVTSQYAVNIRQDVEADKKLLKTIASHIENSRGDLEESQDMLSLWENGAMLAGMALLTSDGEVYSSDNVHLKNLEALSYEAEIAKGVHMCERIVDQENPEKFYLYHFVPVLKDGEPQALLCGIIDLDKLSAQYTEDLSIHGTFIQLIEGDSGAFLIDTIHANLDNTENFRNRKVKKGYSLDDTRADITGGQAGEAAFYSNSGQEFYYCAYEPVGVNDWMVMLVQPESLVFRDANNVRVALKRLAILESAAFLIYFLIVFSGGRKAEKNQERELDRVQYMLEIEEILFNAARKPRSIEAALGVTAEKLTAAYAFFIMYDDKDNEKIYTFRQKEACKSHSYHKSDFPVLRSKIIANKGIISYNMDKLIGDAQDELEKLKYIGIESLMLIPVTEPEAGHVGTLGVANMQHRLQSLELLECVMLSFSMAVKNIEIFQAVEKMGTRDKLTGLKNRNSYQHALTEYEKEQDIRLTCIYVDADGLHDINNSYGHEAGDKLLKTVARELALEFGENIFRVGGDEFVVFCRSESMEAAQHSIFAAEKRIQEKGYHISVGIARWEDEPFVYGMIKQAESRMFEAKRKYHEGQGDVDGIRLMNRKLEETLMEKRNLDVFRAVLSSKYLGVYIVDLKVDTFRSIYIPSYFDEAALKSGGKFSEAVKIYMRQYAREEYHAAFLEFLDYKSMEARLNNGEEPQLLYERPDGMKILLGIYRSPDFDENYRECIWTFEKAK